MRDLPPFSSRTVTEHLARGVAASALLTLALWLLSFSGAIEAVAAGIALVGAVALLRGCPMCWLTGLVGTLQSRRAAQTKQGNPSSGRAG